LNFHKNASIDVVTMLRDTDQENFSTGMN